MVYGYMVRYLHCFFMLISIIHLLLFFLFFNILSFFFLFNYILLIICDLIRKFKMLLKLSFVELAIDRMGSKLWKDSERCAEREGQEHIICSIFMRALLHNGHKLFLEVSR